MLTGKKASFCIINIDKKLRVSLIIYLYKICENTNMMKKRFAIVAAIALGASRMVGFPMMLEDLKVSCSQRSREFSYSDKYGGFFYVKSQLLLFADYGKIDNAVLSENCRKDGVQIEKPSGNFPSTKERMI